MLGHRRNRVRHLREAALSLPLLGPLPGDLVKLILRLLPLDARLRAREVFRDWRFLLKRNSFFWRRIDLGVGCGVNSRFLNPCSGVEKRSFLALLRAACVRAAGNLQSADLSGVFVEATGTGAPRALFWCSACGAAFSLRRTRRACATWWLWAAQNSKLSE